jgi:uncharacterized membrane protein
MSNSQTRDKAIPPQNGYLPASQYKNKPSSSLEEEPPTNLEESLPINPLEEEIKIRLHQEQHSSFSGPIPPPEILQGYENVGLGFADRIISMAEKEQNFRQEIVRTEQRNRHKEISRGQLFGLIIGCVALALGTYTATEGHETAAIAITGGAVVSLVSAFVVGRSKGKAPNEENENTSKEKS